MDVRFLMKDYSKGILSDEERAKLIDALTSELTTLRAKAGISQEEISAMLDVSRQTYGSIERRDSKMSWSNYLSLILFYDYNVKTHDIIRNSEAFPHEFIKRINNGNELNVFNFRELLGDSADIIVSRLDAEALRTIKTLILVEYARCAKIPGDAVVRSFDGVDFTPSIITSEDVEASKALRRIREKRNHND